LSERRTWPEHEQDPGRFATEDEVEAVFCEMPQPMKVVIYPSGALADLDAILDYLARTYPGITRSFEERLQRVLQRIGDCPASAGTPTKSIIGSPRKRSKFHIPSYFAKVALGPTVGSR
jgi:plasmid stabilization system protein ParE